MLLLFLALVAYSHAQVFAPVEPAAKAELAFCSADTPKINGSNVVVSDCEEGCRAAAALTCDGFNYNDGTLGGTKAKGCFFIMTGRASCNTSVHFVPDSEGDERVYIAVDPTGTPSTAPSMANMTAAPSFAPSAGPTTTAAPNTNTTTAAPTIAPATNSTNTLQPTTKEYYSCTQYDKQLCERLSECIWLNEGCYWLVVTAAPTTAPTNSTTFPPHETPWSSVAIGVTVGIFAIGFLAWWCNTCSGRAKRHAHAREQELREDVYGGRQVSWH